MLSLGREIAQQSKEMYSYLQVIRMLRDVVSDARVRLRAAGFVSQAGLVRQLGAVHIRTHAPVLFATLREALLKGTANLR